MKIDQFIEYNFTPIIGMVFQLVILLFARDFNKKERFIFSATLILEALEIAAYNAEIAFSALEEPTVWRTFFSIIGYITRPALVYPFIILMREDCDSFLKKIKYWDLIPLLIVVIIEQLAYGTNVVFYYDEFNRFHRGVLGYISQIVTILYLVEASIEIIISFANKKANTGLIVVVLAYVVSAIVFESIFDIKSLGISAGVISIVFFMFTLQANHLSIVTKQLKYTSEVDMLSKLSNRYSGEKQIDGIVQSGQSGMFAVLDIDKFKHVNDTYGHSIGDEAITKVAMALKECLETDDVIMRLGGDEFAIYSTHVMEYEDALKPVQKLFEHIDAIRLSADANYRISISIGLAKYDGKKDSSFDILYRSADEKLYEAKKFQGNYVCH